MIYVISNKTKKLHISKMQSQGESVAKEHESTDQTTEIIVTKENDDTNAKPKKRMISERTMKRMLLGVAAGIAVLTIGAIANKLKKSPVPTATPTTIQTSSMASRLFCPSPSQEWNAITFVRQCNGG